MEKRIIPWIKKKLIEIIGEDEPTLVEFVSTRLKHKTKPEYILQEIKIALGKFFIYHGGCPIDHRLKSAGPFPTNLGKLNGKFLKYF